MAIYSRQSRYSDLVLHRTNSAAIAFISRHCERDIRFAATCSSPLIYGANTNKNPATHPSKSLLEGYTNYPSNARFTIRIIRNKVLLFL